jgi:glycosyltransferase involved in cell wall biosynthesis
MLVILYTYNENGPGKVIKNLKLGLDSLNVPYIENPTEINYDDDVIALQWSDLILQANPNKLVIGPNICTLPIDNNFVINGKYKNILVPSKWVFDLYTKWLPEEKIKIWPVGIDTEIFSDAQQENKDLGAFVYFKNRDSSDLSEVNQELNRLGISYENIGYGRYNESDLIDKTRRSKYCILVNGTESQGIGVLEILSTNTPMIVLDQTLWTDRIEAGEIAATSVPYWSDECGEIISHAGDIELAIKKIEERKPNPRNYILENFLPEYRASELLEIIK